MNSYFKRFHSRLARIYLFVISSPLSDTRQQNHKGAADYRTWDHVLVCYRASKSSVNAQQFKASVLSSPTDGSSPLGPPLRHAHSCDLRRDHQASAFLIEIPGKIKHGPRKSVSAYYPSACGVGSAAVQLSCSRWDLHFIQCHCQSVEMEMWYMCKPTMASDSWSIRFTLKITETHFWLI